MNSNLKRMILVLSALILYQPSSCFSAPLQTYKSNAEDFFYAQQTSLSIFVKVPKSLIREQFGDLLERSGFEIASFEDANSGYLIVKPMVFTGEFGAQTALNPGNSTSTEIEFVVLVYPKGSSVGTKPGTFSNFLSGRNPKSQIGQLRLDVLCDNEVAVAAGRANFFEHKFLGSFEFSYPSPNNLVGGPKPFSMDMTAYTWQGAGQSERKLFRLQADLSGVTPIPSKFSTELLFSQSPPEQSPGTLQKGVGEYRHYASALSAYLVSNGSLQLNLTYGDGEGAQPLKPAPPFGDGVAIAGSEVWPIQMRDQLKALITSGSVVGYLLFQTPPSEYETRPFVLTQN